MFLPQNIQTQMELAFIADVKKQIISPTSSSPIIQFKQDTPAGVYLLTEKKVDIDWHEAMNMAMYLYDFDATKIQKKNVNTHQLFSYIIPEMINYSEYADGKKTLDINNGELLQGTVKGGVLTDKLITVSISGGVDSMVCSYILKQIPNINFICVHIDYYNRKECEQEEELLKWWCNTILDVPLYIRRIDEINRPKCMEYELRDLYESYTKNIRFNSYITTSLSMINFASFFINLL
jgi:DNA-directed RNA polymerase beta' subunit